MGDDVIVLYVYMFLLLYLFVGWCIVFGLLDPDEAVYRWWRSDPTGGVGRLITMLCWPVLAAAVVWRRWGK